MIEGIGTVSTANQNHLQTIQAQVETPVEKTPDVVEGKVNAVDEVEDTYNKTSSDENTGTEYQPTSDKDDGRIVDLLG